MTRQLMRLLAGLCVLAAPLAMNAQSPSPTTPAIQPIRAVKVILIGDSTVQPGSGWGGAFCAEHVTSFATCVNMGRGGRSSSSYIAEGSWQLALNEMSTPGFAAIYVLIQFGHNDQPGKPGRSTDLQTEFPANIARYVTETRAKSAKPILVTPLTRRGFKKGVLDNDLVPWADAIRKVAKDTGTPLLDLNADSAAAVQALGPVLSAKFAQLPPSVEVAAALQTGTTISASTGVPAPPSPTPSPSTTAPADQLGDPKLAFDYTHLGKEGAAFFSTMVTRELIGVVPELRRFLIR